MKGSAPEVVVVGGGPAGSVAAALLARNGHAVLLLDRARFPRAKPCGESLNPGAVRELRGLGLLPAVLALPHRILTRWRIHPVVGSAFEGRFEEPDCGIAVERAALDALLLQNARREGVQVETGVQVVDLEFTEGAVAGVRTGDGRTIEARLVIGADGLRSVVVRRLGLLRRRPRLRKIALTAHVEGAELPESTGVLCLRSWGCGGIAPISSARANVALVLGDAEVARLGGAPTRFFDRELCEIPYLRYAYRVSDVLTTGPFDWPTRSVTADGALLVGDAAGYYDPFTGQGIYRALRSARLAARTGTLLLQAPRHAKVTRRAHEWRHRAEFALPVHLQKAVEFAVAHPSLFENVARLLRARPALADRIMAVTGDLGSPFSLLLPMRRGRIAPVAPGAAGRRAGPPTSSAALPEAF